jgi:aminoglycoside phosphotransferase (APT) family kinase protein
MEEKEIREICKLHQLPCDNITKVIGSFNKELFFIDGNYLIRTSRQSMLEEQRRINRVKDLKQVPKIVYASDQNSTNSTLFYLILEYLHGCELFTIFQDLKDSEIQDIGIKIADFLSELHCIKGERYDIGHYVPILPDYDGSWRSGHQSYWNYIYDGLSIIQLSDELRQRLELSNQYINMNLSCLDYEGGPDLLHNDFHYKNIMIQNHTFSGVIDWECSQYGEADFDLIHLLHWSLFPPSMSVDMTILFRTIFLRYMKIHRIPMIEKRLTIYLLEHDFIQILWSEGKRSDEFFPRIGYWLSGSLEKYVQKLKESL